jgi:hypothetical protein
MKCDELGKGKHRGAKCGEWNILREIQMIAKAEETAG